MSKNGTTTATTATAPRRTALATPPMFDAAGVPEQLTLLTAADVPLQFRLDERSRRSGLAHVAALRAQVAAQAARRNLSTEAKRSVQRQIAA